MTSDDDMLPAVVDAEVVDGEHVHEPEPGIVVERYRDPARGLTIVRVVVSERWLVDAPRDDVAALEALTNAIASLGRPR